MAIKLFIFLMGCNAVCYGASILKDDGKVVGGEVAKENDAPYQVSLRTPNNFHFCGGSIISERAVLTAAHCIQNREPESLMVVAATHKLNHGGVVHKVDRLRWHDGFNSSEIQYDIGIIIVNKEFSFGDGIKPIRYSEEFVESDTSLTLTGWGATSFPGHAPNDLQIITLKSISNQDCSKRTHKQILESQICTMNGVGQGACFGDSGGPLVYKDILVGIVSWGYPCARGKPDVFTRVSSFKSWIESELK